MSPVFRSVRAGVETMPAGLVLPRHRHREGYANVVRATFERAYAEAALALDASAHCLAYDLARCAEDATQYVLRIEWDSAAGHLQGFPQSPEFRAFFATVRPFVGDIAEMRHDEPTAVTARKASALDPGPETAPGTSGA